MTIPEKLQQTVDELGSDVSTLQIPFLYTENLKIKQRNFVISQTLSSSSNSLILGHSINGKLGVANGLGGGQIVLGQSGDASTIEIIRRRYEWDSIKELEKGTKSSNVDVSQGFLQLGNVTVKNIYLGHKSK